VVACRTRLSRPRSEPEFTSEIKYPHAPGTARGNLVARLRAGPWPGRQPVPRCAVAGPEAKVDVADPRLAYGVADHVTKFDPTQRESLLIGKGFSGLRPATRAACDCPVPVDN